MLMPVVWKCDIQQSHMGVISVHILLAILYIISVILVIFGHAVKSQISIFGYLSQTACRSSEAVQVCDRGCHGGHKTIMR